MFSRWRARRRQQQAARDLHALMAELDRLDREQGLGALPPTHTQPVRRHRRRQTGPVLPGLLITALVLGGVIALSPNDDMRTLRRIVGLDDGRLGALPFLADGDGSYAFSLTQRGSKEPVTYDPCRVIEVVVNPEGAPDDYDELVDTAIRRTSEATGLVFERTGLTDDRDFERRRTLGPGRPPVLVAWATPEEFPELAGRVAGVGGSSAVAFNGGKLRYVTGIVVLDRDLFADFGPGEQIFAQAIVDHEFGHLVGLGHVDDPNELMNEDNVGVVRYGPGDKEGLARLGRVDC